MGERVITPEIPGARPSRMAVMGAMASGKSEMALALGGRWGVEPEEEMHQTNPFLPEFYKDPTVKGISFKSQIYFLTTGGQQMAAVSDKSIEIFDAPVVNHRLFAEIHHEMKWMDEREIEIYRRLYRIITVESGIVMPDFYTVTEAPAEVLLERILEVRGRDFEQRQFFEKHPEYLPRLADAVKVWAKRASEEYPVVVIDSANNNYVSNTEDKESVLGQIENEVKKFLSENPFGKDGARLIVPDFLKAE